MLVELPRLIQDEVRKLAKVMDWPRCGFKYFEMRRPGKSSLWTARENLTIADLEQLSEQFTRLARQSIDRFKRTGSRATAKTAADRIMRATDLRCKYIEVMNLPLDNLAAQMPFPILTIDEAKAINEAPPDSD